MVFNTYVINLDKDIDRWKKQSSILKSIGINPTRVRGLLGNEVSQDFISQHFTNSCQLTCPKSVYGCVSSHLLTFKTFLDTDPAPFALILEDDAYPLFNNVSVLYEFIKTIPPPSDWDMFTLHCDGNCPENKVTPKALSVSGAAYLISKRGAEKLLQHKFAHHIDLSTNLIPGFVKLLSPKNFFWTDEDSVMINSATPTSNNRIETNQWSTIDQILDILFKTFIIERGEKTWKHIRNYKAIRLPYTQIELTVRDIMYIFSILGAMYSKNKLLAVIWVVLIFTY